MPKHDIGAELLLDLRDHLTELLTSKTGIPAPEAKLLAQEAAAKVADNWGGQSVYIPKDQVAKMSTRNAEILAAFSGDNISELVRTFGLSRQAIYRIIKAERDRRAPRQGSLFQNMK